MDDDGPGHRGHLGRHLGHCPIGCGDDQHVDTPSGVDRIASAPVGLPYLIAPSGTQRRHQRPTGSTRTDDTDCGHQTPFDVPAPMRVPFESENLVANTHSVPTTVTSPPATSRDCWSTRSGARSARGARTNRRWRPWPTWLLTWLTNSPSKSL